MKSEQAAGIRLEYVAGFAGIRKLAPLRSALLFAGLFRPGSNGNVIGKGETVKINLKTGDFYTIARENQPPQIVPVSTINVSEQSIQNGQVIPVPPLPTQSADTVSHATTSQAGQLYGKLKVPFTLDGKVLKVGDFVSIKYESGDRYVLSNSFVNPARISKAGVDLVDKIYYLTNLRGTIKAPIVAFRSIPDLIRNPGSLDQLEQFSNMNPTLKAGEEISITAREGSDYLILIGQRAARIPISAVNITYGDPNTGAAVFIAPEPQNTNPSAPGYIPPPPQPVNPIGVVMVIAIPFVIISALIGLAGFIYRRIANASTVKHGEPDYGVPHTHFIATENGFTISFVRSSTILYKATHISSAVQGSGGLASILLGILLLIFLFFILLWYGIESFFKTVITVDPEFISINGNKMPRHDFGNFVIDHSLSSQQGQVAVLGYQFGRRTFPFGGVWDDGQAQEVASALNSHIRSTPIAGDEHNPSPEVLRAVRPNDF